MARKTLTLYAAKKRIRELEKGITTLTGQCEEAVGENSDLRSAILRLEADIRDRADQTHRLGEQLACLSGAKTTLGDAITALDERLTEANASRASANETIGRLTSERDAVLEEVARVNGDLAKANEKIKGLTEMNTHTGEQLQGALEGNRAHARYRSVTDALLDELAAKIAAQRKVMSAVASS